jgi:hypothetical protein
MSDERQLLHIVIGGELKDVGPKSIEFKDLANVEFVGAYPDYQSAKLAWRSAAQQSVDNAHMRFFIIHAHKLLDPSSGEPQG